MSASVAADHAAPGEKRSEAGLFSPRPTSWLRAVLLIALAVLLYFQTWADLWPLWENKNATYTHGSLIAAVILWLVWRARRELVHVPAVASPLALPVVLVLSAAWLVAARSNILVLHAFLWPLLALSMIWAGVGARTARVMAFPLAFLYFAIPIWDFLMPPLQAISSAVVGQLTEWVGIDAVVDGHFIRLPRDTIFIAHECSGAHFLSVAMAIGVLAGALRGDRLGFRVVIVLFAALLSMIFNWLRIFTIVLAYLHPDFRHMLESMGHYTFGWWVFALDLAVFFAVLRLVPPASAIPATTEQVRLPPVNLGVRGRAGFLVAVLASAALPTASWALVRVGSYPPSPAGAPSLPDFVGPLSADGQWRPGFTGAAWEHRVAYVTNEGRVVELYRNEYHRQAQGDELVQSGREVFDSAVFSTITSERLELAGPGGRDLDVNIAELVTRSGRKWLGLYVYVVDDVFVLSPYRAQFVTGLRAVFGHPTAGVLAVAAPCAPDCRSTIPDLGEALLEAHAAYTELQATP